MNGLKFIDKKINGRRRAISISKIKKISLMIKNCVLKGKRALDDGLKPHSKGDIFSWFKVVFFEIKKFNRKRKREIKKKRTVRRIIFIYLY